MSCRYDSALIDLRPTVAANSHWKIPHKP